MQIIKITERTQPPGAQATSGFVLSPLPDTLADDAEPSQPGLDPRQPLKGLLGRKQEGKQSGQTRLQAQSQAGGLLGRAREGL